MQEKQKKLQEESRADQEYIKKWQVFFFNFSLPVRQRGRGRESVHYIILDYGVWLCLLTTTCKLLQRRERRASELKHAVFLN